MRGKNLLFKSISEWRRLNKLVNSGKRLRRDVWPGLDCRRTNFETKNWKPKNRNQKFKNQKLETKRLKTKTWKPKNWKLTN